MMKTSLQLCFFFILLLLNASNGGKGLCLKEKDYKSCYIGSSCYLHQSNPCGCKHACCAPERVNGKQPFVQTVPFLYGYRCYKKLNCGQMCGGNGAMCGCADGLVCAKDKHTKLYLCTARK